VEKLLQAGLQILSTWINVPPVKSKPGLNGAWIGESQDIIKPSKLINSRKTVRTMQKRRYLFIRKDGSRSRAPLEDVMAEMGSPRKIQGDEGLDN
jgi:hypothetical protein